MNCYRAIFALVLLLLPVTAAAQDLSDAELSRWTQHILELEQRVARDADNAQLMIRLSSAYVSIGDVRRAMPALERLADLRVNPVRISLLRGDLHLNVGEYDAAARAYLDVLARAPRQTHALSQLWRLMLRITVSDDGEVSFDRQAVVETLQNGGLYFPDEYRPAANGPDQASRLVDRAGSLLMRQRPEEATVLLMRAIAFDPGNADAFAGLARCYTANNDPESAVGAWLVYLLLAPDAPDAPRVRQDIGRAIERANLR